MDNATCVICFDKVETDGDKLVLQCGHAFHQSCIRTWLKTSLTCPVCRQCPIPRIVRLRTLATIHVCIIEYKLQFRYALQTMTALAIFECIMGLARSSVMIATWSFISYYSCELHRGQLHLKLALQLWMAVCESCFFFLCAESRTMQVLISMHMLSRMIIVATFCRVVVLRQAAQKVLSELMRTLPEPLRLAYEAEVDG